LNLGVKNLAKLTVLYDDDDNDDDVDNDGSYIQGVTERWGQTLDMSSKYQKTKKCPKQHVSGNINL
jgi:hypothetical protein